MLLHVRLVVDDGEHEPLAHKLGRDLVRLLAVDGGGAVHEPVRRGLAGESVAPPLVADLALARHLDADDAVLIVARRVRVCRVGRLLGVGTVLADESPEDDLDGGALHRQLVRGRVALEVDQMHGIAGRVDGLDDVLLVDAVALAEASEDVQALGRQLPEAALEREEVRRLAVGRLDEARVHEALAHGPGHLAGHREGRRRRGRDDP